MDAMTRPLPRDEADRPTPRPGILDITPYRPGKSKAEGFEHPVKLSSNENILGCSPAAKAAVAASVDRLHLYPDGRSNALREAVARRYGLEPDRLVFGDGTDEVLHLINQVYLEPGDNIIQGQYGFGAYAIGARACGAEVRFEAREERWTWTQFLPPGSSEARGVQDMGSAFAAGGASDRLAPEWTLVPQDAPAKLVFEQETPLSGLRFLRIFSFGNAAAVLRIETQAQAIEGERELTRAGLLDVRIAGEPWRETGPAPASFPLFGRTLFAGIEHVSGIARAEDDIARFAQTRLDEPDHRGGRRLGGRLIHQCKIASPGRSDNDRGPLAPPTLQAPLRGGSCGQCTNTNKAIVPSANAGPKSNVSTLFPVFCMTGSRTVVSYGHHSGQPSLVRQSPAR